MYVGIWRFALREFERGNAKRPYVGLVVVAGLLDDFRGHPEGSPNECVLLRHGRRELARDTEIGQFDLAVGAHEDVCGCIYINRIPLCLEDATHP